MRVSKEQQIEPKRRVKVALFILFSAIITLGGGACLIRGREGKVAERWQSGNNAAFKIRILKYLERGDPSIPGAYYVFQSAPVKSEEWTDIMTFRHDDPVSIPQNQVRFVNDRIGYVFMGWKYAVTTDGGATWTVWDAYENMPEWKCCHYKLIEDVRVEANGNGSMIINPALRELGFTDLYTKDYGRHWDAKRAP